MKEKSQKTGASCYDTSDGHTIFNNPIELETALFIGRVISNTLFILMAFLDANFIMAIFVIFVILQAISVIKLQSDMNKCNEVNQN